MYDLHFCVMILSMKKLLGIVVSDCYNLKYSKEMQNKIKYVEKEKS